MMCREMMRLVDSGALAKKF